MHKQVRNLMQFESTIYWNAGN